MVTKSPAQLTESLHIQCADAIYRAERNICPCCNVAMEPADPPYAPQRVECFMCGFYRVKESV